MLLNPQVFGKEHWIFLTLLSIIGIGSLVLAKLYLKTEKSQWIYMRVMAAIILIGDTITRIGVGLDYGWLNAIPNTFCSMTGFLFSIVVLFGKKNLYVYNGLWYLAIFGGLVSVVYPDFISQGTTIWHLNTMAALVYHGVMFFLCIAMGMFKVFRPSIKRSWVFPLTIALYIAFGSFLVHFLKVDDAMCIVNPMLSGTPIDCWLILAVGTALVYLAAFLYEFTPKWVKKIKEKKASKSNGEE